MGSLRTNEDDVAKISTSVFITNFSDSCSAKELFQSCKQYGHVVDTFIPTKRSKKGRFGFVRFINVFNEEILVNNLCKVWIDRFNIARFHRPPLKEKNVIPKKDGGGKSSNSYVFKEHSGFNGGYMGELCVLLEFGSEDSMKLFQDNVSIGSWFSQLKQATMEFTNEGRIAWVKVEGIPFKLWTDNTFKRIATKWGELLDIDDKEEMYFHSRVMCSTRKQKRTFLRSLKERKKHK
ncbi:nucleotide-binding alpha-beta plait domain-containing protein [Tanacetum coccineum]